MFKIGDKVRFEKCGEGSRECNSGCISGCDGNHKDLLKHGWAEGVIDSIQSEDDGRVMFSNGRTVHVFFEYLEYISNKWDVLVERMKS